MSTITNNLTALTAALNLDRNQELMNASMDQLSSGSALVDPASDPAALSTADTLTSDNSRLSAASTNVQNALSYTQTADGFLSNVSQLLTRMGELATDMQDPTKNSGDIADYEVEFQSLQTQLRNTIGGDASVIGGTSVTDPEAAFNGTALFGSTATGGQAITVGDQASESLTIPDNDLQTGALATLITQDGSGNFTLSGSASTALSDIDAAIDQIGTATASNGAVESRLALIASTLTTQQQNMTSAISGISDVDVAQESTQLARYNILVQSSASMLAQANQDPEEVLKLITGTA
jgi:flagellin